MKSKEELLKIYSAYLPYELKLQHLWMKAKHKPETTLRSWVKDLQPLDLGCFFPDRKDTFDWKPILYSMDMLTKEIEHKGERFVPIVELAKIGTRENNCYITNSNLGTCYVNAEFQKKGFFMYHINGYFIWQVGKNAEPLTVWNQIQLFSKLFEWHFNVFGLDESEYIKKESLK